MLTSNIWKHSGLSANERQIQMFMLTLIRCIWDHARIRSKWTTKKVLVLNAMEIELLLICWKKKKKKARPYVRRSDPFSLTELLPQASWKTFTWQVFFKKKKIYKHIKLTVASVDCRGHLYPTGPCHFLHVSRPSESPLCTTCMPPWETPVAS